jgi:hypothetical protein
MGRRRGKSKQQHDSTTTLTMDGGMLQRQCATCGQHTLAGGVCPVCEQQGNRSLDIQAEEQGRSQVQRSPDPSGFSHDISRVPVRQGRPLVQAKLTVGAPGDKYEQEADRVADQVMRMPAPEAVPETTAHQPQRLQQTNEDEVQRQYEEEAEEKLKKEEDEEEKAVQTKERSGQVPTVTPGVEAQLSASQGRGQPLSPETRSFMEPRFEQDFSGVRVHTDANAAQLNRDLNAQAFTHKQDVYFGAGDFRPDSDEGRRLLAHELTHVVQQKEQQKDRDTFLEQNPENLQENNKKKPRDFSKSLSVNDSEFIQCKSRKNKGNSKKLRTRNPKAHQLRLASCKELVKSAQNIRQYIAIFRRAEEKLIKCGFKDPSVRIKILSEIYYGTVWSRDYQVEKSEVRNLGFQLYTRRSNWGIPREGSDPRDCLGCGLFLSLRKSGDISGVDMGHLLIGLNARASSIAREGSIVPLAGTSGLENVTWVGDLGGAAARVAIDRVSNSKAGVARYFRGKDYGAPSNLKGDIAAYVVASGTQIETKPTDLQLTSSGLISDALEMYFLSKDTKGKNPYKQFLVMLGGTFKDESLQNKLFIELFIAKKIMSFAVQYMINFLRQHEKLEIDLIMKAKSYLPEASLDVARRFLDWLLKIGRLE